MAASSSVSGLESGDAVEIAGELSISIVISIVDRVGPFAENCRTPPRWRRPELVAD
jgi:hypothetical protein